MEANEQCDTTRKNSHRTSKNKDDLHNILMTNNQSQVDSIRDKAAETLAAKSVDSVVEHNASLQSMTDTSVINPNSTMNSNLPVVTSALG